MQKWLVIKNHFIHTWEAAYWSILCCVLPPRREDCGINTYALNRSYYGKQPFRYHRKSFWSAVAVVGKLHVAASSCVLQALPNKLTAAVS